MCVCSICYICVWMCVWFGVSGACMCDVSVCAVYGCVCVQVSVCGLVCVMCICVVYSVCAVWCMCVWYVYVSCVCVCMWCLCIGVCYVHVLDTDQPMSCWICQSLPMLHWDYKHILQCSPSFSWVPGTELRSSFPRWATSSALHTNF